jgi:hypothetical protein
MASKAWICSYILLNKLHYTALLINKCSPNKPARYILLNKLHYTALLIIKCSPNKPAPALF